MNKIKIMDELLANKIAAGEVVERCSSVVKELVENSIDAGATNIRIELIEAGTKMIKVVDNGSGMEYEDAKNAFFRHATSKIVDEEDLFNVNTLGFRGEALPSIASVSNIELNTSVGGAGTTILIDGGVIKEVKTGSARVGTSIAVKNLFYNTPARLKYLKSLYTELAHITEYINKMALSLPGIKFVLINNDNVLLNTDGSGSLLKVIKGVYGAELARNMIAVSGENNDYKVEGYISKPEIHRSSRKDMITLVNNRVIRNTQLNKYINDAYHGYKPDNRYSVVVLNIYVDPRIIDVNIHPTKMDIKFSKNMELMNLVTSIIRGTLVKMNHIPVVISNEEEAEFVVVDNYGEVEDVNPLLAEEQEVYEVQSFDFGNIDNEEITVTEKERMPVMYPVGLVHGTYIIAENETGMYIIDQHAANERINYELYMEEFSNPSKNRISMLVPLTHEYSSTDYIILKENFEFLNSLGIEISEFGINSIIVKGHPNWLPKNYETDALINILDLVINMESDFSIVKFNEAAATMLACKMSIKANEQISFDEMEELLTSLRKCSNPYHCPHGRPTVIFYSTNEIEKLFKRSGF